MFTDGVLSPKANVANDFVSPKAGYANANSTSSLAFGTIYSLALA